MIPVLKKLKDTILLLRSRLFSNQEIFTKIYTKNTWKGESRSGPGSDLDQTETIRMELPKLFKELEISTLLDIPCGDFNWLKKVNLDFLSYTGSDIVKDIIDHNNVKYSKKNREFVQLNILEDELPKVDMILCRDLLQHLPNKDIFKAMDNIKRSNSKYLLTSSQIAREKNTDTFAGGFRPLNLILPPFSFPKPIRIISEKNPTENDFDKSLLLWKISDI